LPLVATGYGYDRPWRLGSWDRFAIPRPFSRARAVSSGELHVPPGLDRGGLEHFRRKIEQLLNRLTDEAEAWAESATRKVGQYILRPRHARRFPQRVDAPAVLAGPHCWKEVGQSEPHAEPSRATASGR